MTWLRLDDLFVEHPKIVALSDRAFRAHISGMCYASRYLTDGRVPAAVARSLGRRYVGELVAAGVWTEDAGGLMIHDFLEYNPPRAKVEAERKGAAERMATVRANKRRSSASPTRPGVPSEHSRAKRSRKAEVCPECGIAAPDHIEGCTRAARKAGS